MPDVGVKGLEGGEELGIGEGWGGFGGGLDIGDEQLLGAIGDNHLMGLGGEWSGEVDADGALAWRGYGR